jgi:hypothetical protein
MEKDEFALTAFLSDPSSDGFMSSKKYPWMDFQSVSGLDVHRHCPMDDLGWSPPEAQVYVAPKTSDLFPHSSPNLNPPPDLSEVLVILRSPEMPNRIFSGTPKPRSSKTDDSKKHRPRFPEQSRRIILNWLGEHAHHPYPTREEFEELRLKTNLTETQLRVFLVNNRARKLNYGEIRKQGMSTRRANIEKRGRTDRLKNK